MIATAINQTSEDKNMIGVNRNMQLLKLMTMELSNNIIEVNAKNL